MNIRLFPYFDEVFTYARDISVFSNSVSLIVLALIASFKPKVLQKNTLFTILVVTVLLGGFLLWNALSYQHILLLVLASSMVSIGRALSLLMLMVFISSYSPKDIPVILLSGLALSLMLSSFFSLLDVVSVVGYFSLVPLVIGLSLLKTLDLDTIVLSDESPSEASLLQPSTVVPFQSQIFIAILVFQIGFGISLRLGEVRGIPLFATELSVVVLLLLLVASLLQSNSINIDRIIDTSIILFICALVLIAMPIAQNQFWATTLL